MFSLTSLFFGTAWAQAPAAAAPVAQQTSMLAMIEPIALPLGLILMAYYFTVLRPQQATLAHHTAMLKGLQKGDKVVTAGGILGSITRLDDETVTVEIADGVAVKVVRSTLTDIVKPKADKPKSESVEKKKK